MDVAIQRRGKDARPEVAGRSWPDDRTAGAERRCGRGSRRGLIHAQRFVRAHRHQHGLQLRPNFHRERDARGARPRGRPGVRPGVGARAVRAGGLLCSTARRSPATRQHPNLVHADLLRRRPDVLAHRQRHQRLASVDRSPQRDRDHLGALASQLTTSANLAATTTEVDQSTDQSVGQQLSFPVTAGQSYTITKYVGVQSSQDTPDPAGGAQTQATSAAATGFNSLVKANDSAWAALWKGQIDVLGNSTLAGDVNASEFYLWATTRAGVNWSISPA